MRKIEVYVETNKTGSRCSTVIEVDDDATDDAIERPAREAMFEMIEWGWRVPGCQDRLVLYVAHPLAPLPEEIAEDMLHPTPRAAALERNLRRAMGWLSWLRRAFPEATFIAPWIAAVMSGEDDADPTQREAGLIDAEALVPRCDGVVLVGGRISSGMARERAAARRVWDLTSRGARPPKHDDILRPRFDMWAQAFEVRS